MASVCVSDPRTWDETNNCPPIRCSVLRCTRCTVNKAAVEVPSMFVGARLVEAMKKFPAMDQVVGLDDAKQELNQILAKSKSGSEPGKNFILLVGVSGTGKSMLAKATTKKLIEETGSVYFYIQPDTISLRENSSDGLKTLDALFKEAVRCQPSVIVIEFMDNVIPKASRELGNAEMQERKSVLALRYILHLRRLQLESQVYVIGVTDRPSDMRVSALKLFRRGVVYCPPPTGLERSELLRIFLEKMNYSITDAQLMSIGFSEKAGGFSRWDMKSLVNDLSMMPQLKRPVGPLSRLEEKMYLGRVIHDRLQLVLVHRNGSIRRREIIKLLMCLSAHCHLPV